MIVESVIIAVFALGLDFAFGDPKNKYHPTAWIGTIIARLTPVMIHQNATVERIGGFLVVSITMGIVLLCLAVLYGAIAMLAGPWLFAIYIVLGSLLLKSTIAIRGMKRHAFAVLACLEDNNLESARANLSMIVKRDAKDLDKNHIISGVLESISENTVDGITGPLFYFAVFGIPGAFVYRIVNTADSMIAYKNDIFKNIGWFAAICDTVLNFIPSRLTGLLFIVSAAILAQDWRASYNVMIRDGRKTASPNAGYPMAALAGALGTRFEKIDHYKLGNGDIQLTKQHIQSAISMMYLTSLLFFIIIVVPIIVTLGWIFNA